MRPTTRAICNGVAEYFGITTEELLGRDRSKSFCEARSIAMWLVRRRFGLSYPELGREFKRDHTTCISSVRRVERARPDGLLRATADNLAADLLECVLLVPTGDRATTQVLN